MTPKFTFLQSLGNTCSTPIVPVLAVALVLGGTVAARAEGARNGTTEDSVTILPPGCDLAACKTMADWECITWSGMYNYHLNCYPNES